MPKPINCQSCGKLRKFAEGGVWYYSKATGWLCSACMPADALEEFTREMKEQDDAEGPEEGD